MKKLNLHRLEQYFIDKNQQLFTTRDVMVIFDTTKNTTQAFLFNNVKKGAIVRLKAGLFALSFPLANQLVIANKLVIPSYISLETALSFYNLIPETVYTVTSVTSKATKEFEVNNIGYIYQKIKVDAFTGYSLSNIQGDNIYIADAEKAISDFLYFVFLGKKTYNDRLEWKNIDFMKVKNYLEMFGNKNIIKFAKKIYKKYA